MAAETIPPLQVPRLDQTAVTRDATISVLAGRYGEDWPIGEMLRTGQRSLDGKRVYIMDYPLRLFVFNEDEGKTLTAA